MGNSTCWVITVPRVLLLGCCRRALPLEHAVARVCREGSARIPRNVRLAEMNLDVPVPDERRIEIVANGLPWWHGFQLALDATIVSTLTRRGEAHPAQTPCQAARSMLLPGASVTALTPNSAATNDAAFSSSAPGLAAGSTVRQDSAVPPPSPRTCDLPRSPPG